MSEVCLYFTHCNILPLLLLHRPQILVLMKLQEDLEPKYRRMFSFARQLKAGKGLSVVASVLEGDYLDMKETALQAKQVKARKWKLNIVEPYSI